jgi:peptidoglycan hydrolase FlgJ
MSIVLPYDIVSDVLNAADPASARAAAANLSRLSPIDEAGFGVVLGSREADAAAAGVSTDAGAASTLPAGANLGAMSRPATPGGGPQPSAYLKFEAFVLQAFFETMLPRNQESFGKGTAGEVWRSMLAEQFGTQVAKMGGIGIARMLAAAHPSAGTPPRPADGDLDAAKQS